MDKTFDKNISIGKTSSLFRPQKLDVLIYRFFEILPGALTWLTLLGVIFFSWAIPIGVAIFIIAFDLYWLIKTVYLSVHLRLTFSRLRRSLATDWNNMLAMHYAEQSGRLWQCVFLPMYQEEQEVIEEAIFSLLRADWPKERMIVVLAVEERAGAEARELAHALELKYKNAFGSFFLTVHPENLFGEIPGKGSNTAWAAEIVRRDVIDARAIPYKDILVSSFDIDTQVHPQYFSCFSYRFLSAKYPHHSSFQPIPVYNNNIWDAPALSRVVATSGTFWQMMQQARPERLTTFSSHSMSFKALVEVGYWQRNVVSEDSRIFWQLFIHFDGNYEVVPLFFPVSMDANVAPTFFQTVKNVYKQQRRWMWGVENIPYLLFGFLKNKRIPKWKRLRFTLAQIEGFWSAATNPILIFLLGWLPLVLGGEAFNTTVLSYNLPRITRSLMTLAMGGLLLSAAIAISLLPPRPPHRGRINFFWMVLQWMLIPITLIVFGAIPAIDAQTRLMFKKYMGFWVTPKHRINTRPVIK